MTELFPKLFTFKTPSGAIRPVPTDVDLELWRRINYCSDGNERVPCRTWAGHLHDNGGEMRSGFASAGSHESCVAQFCPVSSDRENL